jgi:hypothetical protein
MSSYKLTIGDQKIEFNSNHKVLVKKLYDSGDIDINGPYFITCEELYNSFIESTDEYFLITEKQSFINNIEKIKE